FRQCLAPLPQLQRLVQVESALLEHLHDVDEFVAGTFVTELPNIGVRIVHWCCLGSHSRLPGSCSGQCRSCPMTAARAAPSATRTRSCVPMGISSSARTTSGSPPGTPFWTQAYPRAHVAAWQMGASRASMCQRAVA